MAYWPKGHNRLISSPLTVHLTVDFGPVFKLNDNFDLFLRASFSHASNGALRVPNKGVNVLGGQVGLRYFPKGRANIKYGKKQEIFFTMTHKAGYVNIIGRPNVGKSTLMNQLVGEKISIITSKAQTTRHRILGIVNGDDFQIVFSDTPGIIKDPAYKMHEVMNQFVNVALIDADLILFVVDITDKKVEEKTVERLKTIDIPVFVLINKIDLSNQEAVEQAVETWRQTLPNATVFPLSAQYGANVEFILKQILEKLPHIFII